MRAVETQRTLVKSVPELWAELSEDGVLGRMLHGGFGEIRVTGRKPESSIEWEGELAAGLVELDPSVFGTRVRLSATLTEATPAPASSVAAPEPARAGLLARLFRRRPRPPEPERAPEVQAPAAQLDPQQAWDTLTAILDEIGAARHRPFSRDAGASTQIT
jgi:hypothetical protein